jgi:murein DD-endopeptidase MepM/ murein hydrolase activator NlpD
MTAVTAARRTTETGEAMLTSRFPTQQGVFPVQGFWTFGGQGHRFGAPRAAWRAHQGQDIMAERGTPIVTPVSGTVVETLTEAETTVLRPSTGKVSGLGNTVVLQGDGGRYFRFCHLEDIEAYARPGVWLRAGRRVGTLGSSGGWPTPHLHFEIWIGAPESPGSQPIDPLYDLARWSEYLEA